MANSWFDKLVRGMHNGASRRGFLVTLAGLGGLRVVETTARRRRNKGRKKRVRTTNAQQSKPGREVTDLSVEFVSTACGFPVLAQAKGREIAFDFGDRLIFAYPGYEATLTNEASGAWIRVAAPGPEFVKFNDNETVTVKGTGPWIFFNFNPATQEPGIWLLRGHFVAVFDGDRNRLSFEFDGTSRNLCDALA